MRCRQMCPASKAQESTFLIPPQTQASEQTEGVPGLFHNSRFVRDRPRTMSCSHPVHPLLILPK